MARIIQETADKLKKQVTAMSQRMTPEQQRLFGTFLFLAKFTVLAAPLYLLMASGWDAATFRAATATVSGTVLSLAGLDVTTVASTIHGENLVLDVSRDSTGWKSILAFSALVFATSAGRSSKLKAIAAGTVVLLAANVLRITTMFYAVDVFAVDYELLHSLLWRWGLTVVVLGTWLYWLHGTPSPQISGLRAVFRRRR